MGDLCRKIADWFDKLPTTLKATIMTVLVFLGGMGGIVGIIWVIMFKPIVICIAILGLMVVIFAFTVLMVWRSFYSIFW